MDIPNVDVVCKNEIELAGFTRTVQLKQDLIDISGTTVSFN